LTAGELLEAAWPELRRRLPEPEPFLAELQAVQVPCALRRHPPTAPPP
jgi:hypothetical protein